jgi:hypothetical protein
MPNMSYCRWQNTSQDFADCLANLRSLDPRDDHPNTHAERQARAWLIAMAAELLVELGIEDPFDAHAVDAAVYHLDREGAED